MTGIVAITQENIQKQIFTIRGKQVMMDRDLAVLYGVETRRLNEQVRRNASRFPERFMFQMTAKELEEWKSQFAISNKEIMGLRKLPLMFTEPGITMLSAVLASKTAIEVSVKIMDAFVEMRKFLRDNADVFVRLEHVERKQHKADENFDKIFDALQSNNLKPKQGVFYDGQVFDAYTFVADLVRAAKQSLVLIDNYIDDSVLRLFAKREKGTLLTIYTQKISTQLVLDLQKYNTQYGPTNIKEFKQAHDRFLIIDETDVYHIGASLKDLGKKWFAFSKMTLSAAEMLGKLQ